VIEAKSKLKDGYSVTEIAADLSYNSDSHFIAVFKKSTGTTPKKYAQEKNK
jgi:AraC-like DNA-binding protein